MAFFVSLFCSQLDDIFVCINFFVFVFLFLNISQVGTAVVTRSDGKLALGRLGALCEQVKELMSVGIEVILVTSGAVGVGRQKLRHQRLMNSSFVDLAKPQVELDGKPCAAVGQSGLMALYDSLFSQVCIFCYITLTTSLVIALDRSFLCDCSLWN
jgi:glutamate 5-kinase